MAGVPYEVNECIQMINEINRELNEIETGLSCAVKGAKTDRLRRELRECAARYKSVADTLYRIG